MTDPKEEAMSDLKWLTEDERLWRALEMHSGSEEGSARLLLYGRLNAVRADLDAERKAHRETKAKLAPDCWFDPSDGDASWDSPEEYADEVGHKLGDTFDLTAAVYWKETWRVVKVPDESSDDFDCERIAGQVLAPTEYQKRCAEIAQLHAELQGWKDWVGVDTLEEWKEAEQTWKHTAIKWQQIGEQAQAELAEARKDTARLEFWAMNYWYLYRRDGTWYMRRATTDTAYRGESFRLAIDAAMQSKEGKE